MKFLLFLIAMLALVACEAFAPSHGYGACPCQIQTVAPIQQIPALPGGQAIPCSAASCPCNAPEVAIAQCSVVATGNGPVRAVLAKTRHLTGRIIKVATAPVRLIFHRRR